MNTTDFLNIASAICPDKTAMVFEGKRYTFGQLNERVNRLANGLMKMGVKRGDRVGFIQVNCNQCVETYFADDRDPDPRSREGPPRMRIKGLGHEVRRPATGACEALRAPGPRRPPASWSARAPPPSR